MMRSRQRLHKLTDKLSSTYTPPTFGKNGTKSSGYGDAGSDIIKNYSQSNMMMMMMTGQSL